MLPVSLDCPCLIASSVFSNVYFRPMSYVPSLPVSLDCPCLIASSVFSNVYFRPMSYVPSVASFSGLSMFDCLFGIL